jgi:organic hydroperoxide reductase OsmC/OhrA
MMGTLATVLAGKGIKTSEDKYWAEVEGDIENVNNVLKITEIRVNYHLKTPQEKADDARDALSSYITFCPAAQSVIGCIQIKDSIEIEAMDN